MAENFRSVIRTDPILNSEIPTSEKFCFEPISVENIENQMQALQKNKAIGCDRISAKLLKDAAPVIAPSLAILFNRSLTSGFFPSSWKIGRVTALYKQGDRMNVNNYRPITILPIISKLLERAVHDQLYKYLIAKQILAKEQFGFRAKKSTDAALIHFTDKVLTCMDSGQITGAAFLDLSKAFDTVNHELLLLKLTYAGLSNNTVTWFRSYLTYRSIFTMVDNKRSSTMDVPTGVPQGSILGPLLFILFVNDLPRCLNSCNAVLYADDTVIYYSSSMISDVESKLNADLGPVVRKPFSLNGG